MGSQHREVQRFAGLGLKVPGREAAALVHAAQRGHPLHDLCFCDLARLQKTGRGGSLAPENGQQDVACACLGLAHLPRDDERLVEHFRSLA